MWFLTSQGLPERLSWLASSLRDFSLCLLYTLMLAPRNILLLNIPRPPPHHPEKEKDWRRD